MALTCSFFDIKLSIVNYLITCCILSCRACFLWNTVELIRSVYVWYSYHFEVFAIMNISVVLELFLILGIVFALWYVMWKFVFENNPEIREFFDLDKKSKSVGNGDKKGL